MMSRPLDQQHAYYYPDSHSHHQRHYEREHQRYYEQYYEQHPHHQPQTQPHHHSKAAAATTLHSEQPARELQSQEEEVASFLLSLKHNHRSITPEPWAQSSDKSAASSSAATLSPPVPVDYHHYSPVPANPGPIPLEQLIHKSNSALVSLQDADLVPDALFLAMSQMIPTRMSFQDRVGCYKSRPVGYLGMCCKHCGGQPGFGRYFPNSVRSLAQTTTSQTILKHIGGKCRQCPEELKRAVAQLQRLQDDREAANGKPRYGSRKVFFQRVWDRLHKFENDPLDGDVNMPLPAHTESTMATIQYLPTMYTLNDESGKSEEEEDGLSTPSDEDQSLEQWPSSDGDDKTKP